MLPCKVDTKLYIVIWRKLSSSNDRRPLVMIDMYIKVGNKVWPHNEENVYDITDDFSLVIYNVKIKDEGRYICEITELETDRQYQSETNLTVFGKCFNS